MSLTHLSGRQWIILQQALLTYLDHLDTSVDYPFVRWDDADGPMPNETEIDELSQIVGNMQTREDAPTLRLYHFRQNNSGGRFVTNDDVDVNVFIEAASYREASSLAEAVGVYFNGCDSGRDCRCCGDRWNPAWSEGDAVSEETADGYSERRVHRYADLRKRRHGV